jgi:Sortase and related acyltransferases
MIRKVKPDDACDIALIYNYYVENSTITFETCPVTVEEMAGRIADISDKYPFFVYEESGMVVGYCYASLWKKRVAYSKTVESTIYIVNNCQGRGIGRALMNKLIDELREKSFHAVIACVTIPNPSSVKLHEVLGFKQVSKFKEVGYKLGKWLDVGDWELLLNPQ